MSNVIVPTRPASSGCPACGRPFDTIGPDGACCACGEFTPRDPRSRLLVRLDNGTDATPLQPVRSPQFASAPNLGPPAGGNRIAASQERWIAKPIGSLQSEGGAADWLWHGYLAPQAITLLVGLWKTGKTTLLTHLIAALGSGASFVGQPLSATNVLIVTEEAERLWAERRERLSIGDHVSVVSRPFLGRPSPRDWTAFIESVAGQVRRGGVGLVIFDSLPNLWPVHDENAATDVIGALTPLYALTDAGAAVLLTTHPSKGDAGEGRAARGSGALTAFVDIIVELRRFDAARRDDTRRTLVAYSRYDETPSELVLRYDPTRGYAVEGTRADVRTDERRQSVLELLPAVGPGETVEALRGRWPGDTPKPGLRTLERDLGEAYDKGAVRRTGAGTRGDPYHFYRADEADDSIPVSSMSYTGERRETVGER